MRNIAITLITFVSIAASAAEPDASTEGVIASIAQQYDTHALIFMGEWHRNEQQHIFLRALVHDPAFICRTDDIVVEFGNSRLQNIADAYISGDTVPLKDLQGIWRETDVMFAWNAPMYPLFYKTIRDINAAHICPHPVRVILGDPPIDWANVNTGKEFEAFGDRDTFFADVVEREVLAKNHHGLLISGEPHALRKLPQHEGDGLPEPTAAQLIERKHPGALFTIALVTNPAAARTFKMIPPPSFRRVHGSDLEHADFGLIAPEWTATPIVVNGKHDWKLDPAKSWPRMGEVVDGVVYLGGDETRLFPSPVIYVEPEYQQQLRRRAAIIKEYNGQDFLPKLDDLVTEGEAAQKALGTPGD